MKTIKLEFNEIEKEYLINNLTMDSISIIKYMNLDLFNILNKFITKNTPLEVEASKRIIERVVETIKFQEEINIFYDIILIKNTFIASEMIYKISKFVYKIMETNSKNIVYGQHKEKWGGIVGHLDINRKDLAIKIIKFIINERAKHPYISSSYTMSFIGFDIDKELMEQVNNFRTMNKHLYGKEQIKYKYPLFKRNKYKFGHPYKKDYLANRKKTIKRKFRYKNFSNLS